MEGRGLWDRPRAATPEKAAGLTTIAERFRVYILVSALTLHAVRSGGANRRPAESQ
jgi:hypothetical protein